MRPRILGFLTVGRMLFSMFSVSVALCCAGSGVNRVVVVLVGQVFYCSGWSCGGMRLCVYGFALNFA